MINMQVNQQFELNSDFEVVVEKAKKSSTLHHISWPLVKFEPLGGSFPEYWNEGTYWVKMYLFGLLPIGKQAIAISFPKPNSNVFNMKDTGYSRLIQRWDHTITVFKTLDGKIVYSDNVDIHAGLLTPFIWIFANVFFKFRQARWKRIKFFVEGDDENP